MNWWLVAGIIFVLIVAFKFKEIKHKVGLVVVIALLLFMAASFGQLYTNNDLDLTNFDGIVEAGSVYVSWLSNAGSNIMRVSTYAVKQDWESEAFNATLVEK